MQRQLIGVYIFACMCILIFFINIIQNIEIWPYICLYAWCPPLAPSETVHWVQGGCPSLVLSNRPGLPTLLSFVALSLALGVPTTSARLSRASFVSHLLVPPPRRAGPSSWLALWSGMVSHWLSGHFLEYSPRNSFSSLKRFSVTLGLGALLSSPTWRDTI